MLNRKQLELGLGRTPSKRIHYSGQSRRARASWWFSRMREVVDGARDLQATPTESVGTCPGDLYHPR